MKNVKVVIGANYGDEGKGLMTSYFCREARKANQSAVVVMSNGGAQRGHTVVAEDGRRHVFHHFGSGTFEHADTFFCSSFILNPILFRQEYEELDIKFKMDNVKICAESFCRISTPFDMIANQIIEESRGDHRHGSCGLGIWETVLRYEKLDFDNRFWFYLYNINFDISENDIRECITDIRDEYMIWRLKSEGIDEIPDAWKDIWYSDSLITNYIEDLMFMCSKVKIEPRKYLRKFDTIVIENGQGLMLDEKNGDHSTPSSTGLDIPSQIIEIIDDRCDLKIEVCYVTRTYITRHGAGPLPEECDASEILEGIFDKTNVFNPWQGYIRYAKMNVEEVEKRILSDFTEHRVKGRSEWVKTVAVTHTNELPIPDGLHYDYWSDGETHVGRRIE